MMNTNLSGRNQNAEYNHAQKADLNQEAHLITKINNTHRFRSQTEFHTVEKQNLNLKARSG